MRRCAAIAAIALAALLVAIGGALSVMIMPGHRLTSAPPGALETKELRSRLMRHITRLAGDIGERNLQRYAQLQAAAAYIETALRDYGYAVRAQSYVVEGKTVRNIEARKDGTAATEEVIVIGAHYDTELGTPGANDNASGVAAMLEIARLLQDERLPRTVRFVAFVNEELPYFQTQAMGSWRYAQRAAARGDKIVGMLSLETLGYYSDTPGSQRYPFPFGFFYPDRGNFLAFVSDLRSRALLRRTLTAFRQEAVLLAEGAAAPRSVPGVAWSDHWAFWEAGYPALMVTDTALYRYPHYHAPEDTPAKINDLLLARAVRGLTATVAELARAARP